MPFWFLTFVIALQAPATATRSYSFQRGIIEVPSVGGQVRLPTLGYNSATLMLEPTGFPYRITTRTSDFNETTLAIRRNGSCVDAPQSEVVTFSEPVRFSAIPAITIGTFPSAATGWRYLLVDTSNNRTIATKESSKVSRRDGRDFVAFASVRRVWHAVAGRRYVFVFYNLASPAYPCGTLRE